MRLTNHQADLIRASFRAVSEDAPASAAAFYRHLYRVAPDTRRLFVADIGSQGIKLMSTLAVATTQVQDWRLLQPVLEALAMRHLAYGVRPEHYPAVGAALQGMFAERLGDKWT